MAKTTNAEKINRKQSELVAAKAQLQKIQMKIDRLNKEIAELENFEILALSKDLKKPASEIKSLLIELIEKENERKQMASVSTSEIEH